jgi:lactoylglutathione lyase
MNLPLGFIAASESSQPFGFEVAFVALDVAEAYKTALSAGATEVKAPEAKPWGQIVAYVRCPDGTLVEICSPVGG